MVIVRHPPPPSPGKSAKRACAGGLIAFHRTPA
jgi:hypothetical protein